MSLIDCGEQQVVHNEFVVSLQKEIIDKLKEAWLKRPDESLDQYLARVCPPELNPVLVKRDHARHLANVTNMCCSGTPVDEEVKLACDVLETRMGHAFFLIKSGVEFGQAVDCLPHTWGDKVQKVDALHWLANRVKGLGYALDPDTCDGVVCRRVKIEGVPVSNCYDDGSGYSGEGTKRPKSLREVAKGVHNNAAYEKEMYRFIFNSGVNTIPKDFHDWAFDVAKSGSSPFKIEVFRPDRTRIAFDNGVFCAKECRFVEWGDYDSTSEPHNANYLRGYEMDPLWSENNLPETPATDKIFASQKIFPGTDLHRAIRALTIGRMLFPLKMKDNWQVIPFIVGVAGTGKSTLAESIIYKIYPFSKVAVIDAQAEPRWMVHSMKGRYLFCCSEMTGKCSWNQGTFQQLTSGERVMSEGKFMNPESTALDLPGIMMANESLVIKNTRGSGTRRVVGIRFMEEVSRSRQNGSLSRDVEKEIAENIYLGVRDYLWLCNLVDNEFGGSIWNALWSIDATFFQKGTAAAFSDHNVISSFVDAMVASGKYILDPMSQVDRTRVQYYISFEEFQNECNDFAKNRNRDGDLKWTERDIANGLDLVKARYLASKTCRWPPTQDGFVEPINIISGIARRSTRRRPTRCGSDTLTRRPSSSCAPARANTGSSRRKTGRFFSPSGPTRSSAARRRSCLRSFLTARRSALPASRSTSGWDSSRHLLCVAPRSSRFDMTKARTKKKKLLYCMYIK